MKKPLIIAFLSALCLSGTVLVGDPSKGVAFAPGEQVAFLGDSISTGAASHPSLHFDNTGLLRIFKAEELLSRTPAVAADLETNGFTPALSGAPRRLLPSKREFNGGFAWLAKHTLLGFAHLYLDSEELSWSYLVGRELGAKGNDILIAAEDGARMSQSSRQVDRVLDATNGQLPRHTFIFFTGNDLCGPTLDYVTESKAYGDALEETLRYMLDNGTAAGDVNIWVVNPLSVLQLVQSEEILKKQVYAHGSTMTCRDLQTKNFARETLPLTQDPSSAEALSLLQFFPQSPFDYCPTVFGGTGAAQREQQIQLANRIHAYRKEITKRVALFAKTPHVNVRQIHDTSGLLFAADDIAQDCFHLSYKGQMKLARTALKTVQGQGLQARSQ